MSNCKAFRRNYSIHSVGSANLAAVEAYVASQLERHRMADKRVQLHLAKQQVLLLGCDPAESPQEVALGYLNNLAYAQRMRRVYQYGFYVGTVGEYDLGAIRGNL